MKFYLNFLVSVRPRQNENTLWRQYVARPWENAAVLLRDTQIQEMFLKVFRNNFCVHDAKFVSAANVARVAKRVRLASTRTCPRFFSALNRNTAAFRIVGKLPRVTGPSRALVTNTDQRKWRQIRLFAVKHTYNSPPKRVRPVLDFSGVSLLRQVHHKRSEDQTDEAQVDGRQHFLRRKKLFKNMRQCVSTGGGGLELLVHLSCHQTSC